MSLLKPNTIKRFGSVMEYTEKRFGNNIRSKRTVLLGNPFSASQQIYVDESTKQKVYVHGLGNEPDSVMTISSGGIPRDRLIYKQPLLIELLDSGNWKSAGIDVDADEQFSTGLDIQHDQTPIKLSQLDYGTLHPTAGLVLLVKGAIYADNYVGDTLTADFSTGTVQDTSASNITIPTTNNRAKAILIQVDASAGTLSYKQSSEFNASVTLAQAYTNSLLPTPDSSNYRVGYAKLVKGITQFDYSHLWVVPEFLSKGGSEWPVTLSANRTLSANTQIVLAELTIPTGLSLTIESTAVMKVV